MWFSGSRLGSGRATPSFPSFSTEPRTTKDTSILSSVTTLISDLQVTIDNSCCLLLLPPSSALLSVEYFVSAHWSYPFLHPLLGEALSRGCSLNRVTITCVCVYFLANEAYKTESGRNGLDSCVGSSMPNCNVFLPVCNLIYMYLACAG